MGVLTQGPAALMVVSGDRALDRMEKIAGSTDPALAYTGTIRARFGRDITHNAVDVSSSPEALDREIEIFFGEKALAEYASKMSRYLADLKKSL